jgi:hypothetical protein
MFTNVSHIIKKSIILNNGGIPPRYNWNIVESGVKHYQTNHNPTLYEGKIMSLFVEIVYI